MFEQGRSLNLVEFQRYQPYFKAQTLQKVRIFEERVPFWLNRSMCAVVLGHRIYFRSGSYRMNTPQGIALLAHELTHVEQYLSGMTILKYLWASRHGYRKNPYEIEAYKNGAAVMDKIMLSDNSPDCKEV